MRKLLYTLLLGFIVISCNKEEAFVSLPYDGITPVDASAIKPADAIKFDAALKTFQSLIGKATPVKGAAQTTASAARISGNSLRMVVWNTTGNSTYVDGDYAHITSEEYTACYDSFSPAVDWTFDWDSGADVLTIIIDDAEQEYNISAALATSYDGNFASALYFLARVAATDAGGYVVNGSQPDQVAVDEADANKFSFVCDTEPPVDENPIVDGTESGFPSTGIAAGNPSGFYDNIKYDGRGMITLSGVELAADVSYVENTGLVVYVVQTPATFSYEGALWDNSHLFVLYNGADKIAHQGETTVDLSVGVNKIVLEEGFNKGFLAVVDNSATENLPSIYYDTIGDISALYPEITFDGRATHRSHDRSDVFRLAGRTTYIYTYPTSTGITGVYFNGGDAWTLTSASQTPVEMANAVYTEMYRRGILLPIDGTKSDFPAEQIRGNFGDPATLKATMFYDGFGEHFHPNAHVFRYEDARSQYIYVYPIAAGQTIAGFTASDAGLIGIYEGQGEIDRAFSATLSTIEIANVVHDAQISSEIDGLESPIPSIFKTPSLFNKLLTYDGVGTLFNNPNSHKFLIEGTNNYIFTFPAELGRTYADNDGITQTVTLPDHWLTVLESPLNGRLWIEESGDGNLTTLVNRAVQEGFDLGEISNPHDGVAAAHPEEFAAKIGSISNLDSGLLYDGRGSAFDHHKVDLFRINGSTRYIYTYPVEQGFQNGGVTATSDGLIGIYQQGGNNYEIFFEGRDVTPIEMANRIFNTFVDGLESPLPSFLADLGEESDLYQGLTFDGIHNEGGHAQALIFRVDDTSDDYVYTYIEPSTGEFVADYVNGGSLSPITRSGSTYIEMVNTVMREEFQATGPFTPIDGIETVPYDWMDDILGGVNSLRADLTYDGRGNVFNRVPSDKFLIARDNAFIYTFPVEQGWTGPAGFVAPSTGRVGIYERVGTHFDLHFSPNLNPVQMANFAYDNFVDGVESPLPASFPDFSSSGDFNTVYGNIKYDGQRWIYGQFTSYFIIEGTDLTIRVYGDNAISNTTGTGASGKTFILFRGESILRSRSHNGGNISMAAGLNEFVDTNVFPYGYYLPLDHVESAIPANFNLVGDISTLDSRILYDGHNEAHNIPDSDAFRLRDSNDDIFVWTVKEDGPKEFGGFHYVAGDKLVRFVQGQEHNVWKVPSNWTSVQAANFAFNVAVDGIESPYPTLISNFGASVALDSRLAFDGVDQERFGHKFLSVFIIPGSDSDRYVFTFINAQRYTHLGVTYEEGDLVAIIESEGGGFVAGIKDNTGMTHVAMVNKLAQTYPQHLD